MIRSRPDLTDQTRSGYQITKPEGASKGIYTLIYIYDVWHRINLDINCIKLKKISNNLAKLFETEVSLSSWLAFEYIILNRSEALRILGAVCVDI